MSLGRGGRLPAAEQGWSQERMASPLIHDAYSSTHTWGYTLRTVQVGRLWHELVLEDN